MARIRTIKPEFWDDEKMGSLSWMERLLFIGMWTFADDEGIIKANPAYLKSHIFQYDESLKLSTISEALNKFQSLNMIYCYSHNAQAYAWVVKFRIYQRIDKPHKSTNPCPSIQNGKYARAIFGRDGYTCHICGYECSKFQLMGKATDPRVVSLDHIIPSAKGGSNYPSNLKAACISCNKSRGNKDLETFLKESGRFVEDSENVPGTLDDGMEGNGKERERKKTLARDDSRAAGMFETFWKAYPRKKSRGQAERTWAKLRPSEQLVATMVAKIGQARTSAEWTKDGGAYIPHPATWLNNKGWLDDYSPQAGTGDPRPAPAPTQKCPRCGRMQHFLVQVAGKSLCRDCSEKAETPHPTVPVAGLAAGIGRTMPGGKP